MTLLDFNTVASSAFSYLENEFGFSVSVDTPGHLRFEGNGVFVSVRFDGIRSYELSVVVGPLECPHGERDRGFTLGEVLRLAEAPEAKDLALVQVSTQPSLERFARRMADALRTYGPQVLRGEQEAYGKLRALRDRELRTYQRGNDLRFARENARKAWQQRDYAGVVAALGPYELDLAPSETKRLQISRGNKGAKTKAPDSNEGTGG
jgi:hypothetical protein